MDQEVISQTKQEMTEKAIQSCMVGKSHRSAKGKEEDESSMSGCHHISLG